MRKWTIGLVVLTATIGGSVGLWLGTAKPPHARNLVFSANNPDDFILRAEFNDSRYFTLPLDLIPSFAIEMEARNLGEPSSAWGIGASNARGDYTTYPLMIDNSGKVITGADDDTFALFEFPRIQRQDFNYLTLQFDSEGFWTFHINGEFFGSSSLSATNVYTIGLHLYREPQLEWKAIKSYTGG